MNETTKAALAEYLTALGDDELILGQRDAEWCGHAPILEEDIAFANLSLDEIGHANLWYSQVAYLRGEAEETYPDQLVFFRDASGFRNLQLVELPNGDWAFSMLRQFLFDAAEGVRWEALAKSSYAPVAAAAAKIRTEELYHYRHTAAWIRRLGQGTVESRRRLQLALEALWPYTGQLFTPLPGESLLVTAGLVPESSGLRAAWEEIVLPELASASLQAPPTQPDNPDRTQHTPHLKVLLAEMQSVARADPEANW